MQATELEAKQAQVGALDMELELELGEHLPHHLANPQWYLTGIQVGLTSLASFYAACKTIYQNVPKVDTSSWMANLKFAYEKLGKFENLKTAEERAQLMLEVRPSLEMLLLDFEERIEEGDPKFFGDNLSIVQMVAKDVYMASHRLRSWENLANDVGALLKCFGMFKKKQLDAQIAVLLATYRATLEQAGLSEKTLKDKDKVVAKLTEFNKEYEAERRRLMRIRDSIYRGRSHELTDPDDPATDLHPSLVVPYLRAISREGVEYLDRAHSVFQHALQRSPDGLALQQKRAALIQELRGPNADSD